jgi:hypothetical protein
MSNQYNEALYEQIHDECYDAHLDELMLEYRPLLADNSLHRIGNDECYELLDWLMERASKYADEKAPELYNERGE